jgi:alpha-amylase/alpha-mannosidase (GH57 family)
MSEATLDTREEIFKKMKRWTKTMRKLEGERSWHKQNLRMTKYDNISCNEHIYLVKREAGMINRRSARIANLRHLHNDAWRRLSYEDRCRYRFWIANEPFPNDLYEQWEKTGPKSSFFDWLEKPDHASEMKKVIEEYDDKLIVIGHSDGTKFTPSTELKVEMRLTRREAEKIANKIIHFLAISDAAELILDLHDED